MHFNLNIQALFFYHLWDYGLRNLLTWRMNCCMLKSNRDHTFHLHQYSVAQKSSPHIAIGVLNGT